MSRARCLASLSEVHSCVEYVCAHVVVCTGALMRKGRDDALSDTRGDTNLILCLSFCVCVCVCVRGGCLEAGPAPTWEWMGKASDKAAAP